MQLRLIRHIINSVRSTEQTHHKPCPIPCTAIGFHITIRSTDHQLLGLIQRQRIPLHIYQMIGNRHKPNKEIRIKVRSILLGTQLDL